MELLACSMGHLGELMALTFGCVFGPVVVLLLGAALKHT